MSSPATPVKRACDSCHRRKVKCIGEGTNPCKNCVSSGLTCTYNAVPQKKGPKGSRAKVLSELRETQRQTQLAASHHSGFPTGLDFDPQLPHSHSHHLHPQHRSLSPTYAPTANLLRPDLVRACLDHFFHILYPAQPVLDPQRLHDVVVAALEGSSPAAYCLIAALCGYVLTRPDAAVPPQALPQVEAGGGDGDGGGSQALQPLPGPAAASVLAEEAARVRRGVDSVEAPTLTAVLTAYFMFCCDRALDRGKAAWADLREATTLAVALDMHAEETYGKVADRVLASRMRRLYWLLFIEERAYAIHHHRPVTLYPSIQLPTPDEDPTEQVSLTGFLHHINLYKPFDHTFVSLWNKAPSAAPPGWLGQLQKQLSDALPAYLSTMGGGGGGGLDGNDGGSDVAAAQTVDLEVSRGWLRTMVWQLSVSQGFVSAMAQDSTMGLAYPVEISGELLAMTAQFSRQAVEVHGIGMVERLYDIASTLVDVLACAPVNAPTAYEAAGSREYLHRFIGLLSTLPGGQSHYVPLLLSKMANALPGATAMPPLPSHPAQQHHQHQSPYTPTLPSNVPGPPPHPPHVHAHAHGGATPDGHDSTAAAAAAMYESGPVSASSSMTHDAGPSYKSPQAPPHGGVSSSGSVPNSGPEGGGGGTPAGAPPTHHPALLRHASHGHGHSGGVAYGVTVMAPAAGADAGADADTFPSYAAIGFGGDIKTGMGGGQHHHSMYPDPGGFN